MGPARMFFWQCNDKNIQKAKSAGLLYNLGYIMTPKKMYYKLIDKYGSLFVVKDKLN